MIWHPFDRETAPKDRPIAILIHSVPEWMTCIEVCRWWSRDEEFFIDINGTRGRQHPGGTHWCEVEELELPKS
jgi:hypothetical protein